MMAKPSKPGTETLRELELLLARESCHGVSEGHDHDICRGIPSARTAELLFHVVGHLKASQRPAAGNDPRLAELLDLLHDAVQRGQEEGLDDLKSSSRQPSDFGP